MTSSKILSWPLINSKRAGANQISRVALALHLVALVNVAITVSSVSLASNS